MLAKDYLFSVLGGREWKKEGRRKKEREGGKGKIIKL